MIEIEDDIKLLPMVRHLKLYKCLAQGNRHLEFMNKDEVVAKERFREVNFILVFKKCHTCFIVFQVV